MTWIVPTTAPPTVARMKNTKHVHRRPILKNDLKGNETPQLCDVLPLKLNE